MVAPVHCDKLGREIALNQCVAFPSHNTLYIGKVIKLNSKMIKVEALGSKYKYEGNKYPQDVVIINDADVTMWLLRNTK